MRPALLLAVLLGAAATPSVLQRSAPLTATDPEAVCNDGSSAFFYASPKLASAGAHSQTLLVYFQGADWCFDADSCAARVAATPWLTSSASYGPSLSLGGVFDSAPERSPLSGAQLVFVPYCSSDAYAGDAPASPSTGGLAFRGSRVSGAVLRALVAQGRLGGDGASRLLLAGCGAGGLGALSAADSLALSAAGVPASVSVSLFLDSALWLSTAATPLVAQAARLLPYANASGSLGPCAAALAPAAYLCLLGQTRIAFVPVPYLLAQPVCDALQLSLAATHDAFAATAYAEVPAGLVAALGPLPLPAQTRSALFAPACQAGCLSASADLWRVAVPVNSSAGFGEGIDSVTLAAALRAWLWQSRAPFRVTAVCAPGAACAACRNATAAEPAVPHGAAPNLAPAPVTPHAPPRPLLLSLASLARSRLAAIALAMAGMVALLACLHTASRVCDRRAAREATRALAVAYLQEDGDEPDALARQWKSRMSTATPGQQRRVQFGGRAPAGTMGDSESDEDGLLQSRPRYMAPRRQTGYGATVQGRPAAVQPVQPVQSVLPPAAAPSGSRLGRVVQGVRDALLTVGRAEPPELVKLRTPKRRGYV